MPGEEEQSAAAATAPAGAGVVDDDDDDAAGDADDASAEAADVTAPPEAPLDPAQLIAELRGDPLDRIHHGQRRPPDGHVVRREQLFDLLA